MPVSQLPPNPSLPAGWTAGCRDQDRLWVAAHGAIDSVRDVRCPAEALPVIYQACTVILHRLAVNGESQGRRWLDGTAGDPWARVTSIARHGLPELGPLGRFIGDCPLWHVETAQALSDALSIVPDDTLYTCTFFPITREPVVTLTGRALRRRLGQDQGQSNGVRGPLLWFPHDRRWVASSPYDQGFTYVASDDKTAAALRSRDDLEVLACEWAPSSRTEES